ncbi:hypothetical protein Pmani_030254 [Petrolisthes manimaculis]|uniref:Uncharacterized protein n=1 Tax=Petrolisthes manimaculis TaxID=1843537 RepID=A0AAE1TW40_9EUCA|nr:hypothetical protein Pmani_030254 [Petrolisthes manimaculis]
MHKTDHITFRFGFGAGLVLRRHAEGGERRRGGGRTLSTHGTRRSTEFEGSRETRHPGREQPRVSRALSTSAWAGGGVGREINDRVAR